MATNLGSRGWSLFTGLTLYAKISRGSNYCNFGFVYHASLPEFISTVISYQTVQLITYQAREGKNVSNWNQTGLPQTLKILSSRLANENEWTPLIYYIMYHGRLKENWEEKQGFLGLASNPPTMRGSSLGSFVVLSICDSSVLDSTSP